MSHPFYHLYVNDGESWCKWHCRIALRNEIRLTCVLSPESCRRRKQTFLWRNTSKVLSYCSALWLALTAPCYFLANSLWTFNLSFSPSDVSLWSLGGEMGDGLVKVKRASVGSGIGQHFLLKHVHWKDHLKRDRRKMSGDKHIWEDLFVFLGWRFTVEGSETYVHKELSGFVQTFLKHILPQTLFPCLLPIHWMVGFI